MVILGIAAASMLVTTLSKLNVKSLVTENSLVKLATVLRKGLTKAKVVDSTATKEVTASTLGSAGAQELETISL